ncbi:MAG TPA: hypothetical protein V6C58_19310 [Allocoleopsis sp.]
MKLHFLAIYCTLLISLVACGEKTNNDQVTKTPNSPVPAVKNETPINNSSSSSSAANSSTQTNNIQISEWISYESKQGKYTAKFPQQPEESKQNQEQGIKGQEVVYIDQDKKRLYLITYLVLPQEVQKKVKNLNTDQFLENLQKDIIFSMKGNLKTETKIEQNGIKGREFVLDIGQGSTVKARVFFNPKNFQAYRIVIGTKQGNLDFPEAQNFLDSFVIKN